MNNIVLKNILRFIAVLLLQVFVFNKIYLSGYINPYVFLMFVILLPFETPWWLLLLSSFTIGFCVDIFTGSIGVHSAATTAVAFARPALLKIILPKLDRTITVYPGVGYMGIPTFTLYTALVVFIHHFIFFSLEVISFSELGIVFIRTLVSTLISTLVIVLLELIFRKK